MPFSSSELESLHRQIRFLSGEVTRVRHEHDKRLNAKELVILKKNARYERAQKACSKLKIEHSILREEAQTNAHRVVQLKHEIKLLCAEINAMKQRNKDLDAEPDAPRQRPEPRERGPEVRHRGLQRAPAVLVHERVRRELRASLDQPLRLLGELGLEDQLAVHTTHQRARVGQEGARVDGKPRDVALRLRRHAPWPIEHEPAHPKGRDRQPNQGRQRRRLCAWRASAARATELRD